MPVASPLAARIAASPLALRLGDPAVGDLSLLRSVTGGTVVGTIATHSDGSDFVVRKQLSGTRTEDFRLELGTAVSGGLLDWIAASWGAKPPRHDGAVLACDATYTVRSERAFTSALVSETAFPAFDAGSKEPAFMTIRIVPQAVLPAKDPGSKLPLTSSPAAKQKLWLSANFRLAIDGLDCSKVSRIAPFAVRRPVERVSSGGGRGSEIRAGRIDFPSLRIRLSAAAAASWKAWFDDFVVNGNNSDTAERKGSLTLLAPNLADELIRIDFAGLGIFRLTGDPDPDAPPGALATMTAELYCEQMTLVPGGAP